MPFDTWDSYFYPAPDSGTLRNLLDERDSDVLHVKEYGRAALRQSELLSGQIPLSRTYDAEHVRAIHRHLFQDVYEWAGEYRTVNISKGLGRGFGDVRSGEVDRLLADVRDRVAGTDWGALDRGEFGAKAAEVFAYLNQAHPFREGNGRSSKVFMEHVAERSQFTLDFARVSPAVWNQASMLSHPDLTAYHPQPASLVPVFQAVAADRTGATPTAGSTASRHRSVRSASYPRPATEATRSGLETGGARRPTQRPGPRYDVGRD